MPATAPHIERRAAANLPDLLTRAEVAEYLQMSVSGLANWAAEGKGPRFIKMGYHVRYKREDVVAWAASLGDTP